jgi:hypothetical protein
MADLFAYSTDNPATVTAYLQAVADRNAMGKSIHDDVLALGAGRRVMMRGGSFAGDRQKIVAIEQQGDHVPDGWRVVRGNLEPRRGKPGDIARRWLEDHQPIDVRHVMEGHGLPRAVWVPRSDGSFSYRIVKPELFDHDGTLWACYEGEPGKSDSGFDTEPCTWEARKLSEFYAAKEARETAKATADAGAVA